MIKILHLKSAMYVDKNECKERKQFCSRITYLKKYDCRHTVSWIFVMYHDHIYNVLLTGTLHGQPFACACRPLTNRRTALKVDNLQIDR